ncbi:MAG: CoA transferase, partial [Planctomycetota bacterium]
KALFCPLAQASSGFLSLNGAPGENEEPVKSPTFLADDLAGIHGALAALAALRHRDQHGEGQHVDVALLDAMLFQSTGYPTLGAMGVELPRHRQCLEGPTCPNRFCRHNRNLHHTDGERKLRIYGSRESRFGIVTRFPD